MPKFRKRPVTIEAIRYNGANGQSEIAPFLHARVQGRHAPILISTLEGEMRADVGDWLIKGVAGEFYPCKPDIFEQTYERLCVSCGEPTGMNTGEGNICNACIELEDEPHA